VPRLSIAIVCKNNERTLPDVLSAVRPMADVTGGEILAVDSGSTDGTLDLLMRFGVRVINSAWLGHVKTKQLALDEAAGPWVLCLDSDETPTPRLAKAILEAVAKDDPGVAGYRVNRKIWYRERFLEHAWQPEWRLRLVRKGRCLWTGRDPHDRMERARDETRRVEDLAGDLKHDSFETFAEHLGKQVAHSSVAAASALADGVRGSRWRLLTSPAGAFLKQMVIKQAWRDGTAGWLAAGSTAAGALMKHMMMLERESKEPGKSGA
jgi:glycosyltransferase involved in cell wall biosynthesis